MSKTSPYTVYSASAGSGKTFTLVKEYLQILLQNKDAYHFQKVLAITFTNKAAAEMKERVLTTLQLLALGQETEMLQPIMQATDLDRASIQKRSQILIETILQDYSSFNITTIDSFTHRIIRSFAYDFGLSLSFDVEMDAKGLLQESVDAVIDQIGIDPKLTKALVTFSHQKSSDDKSWDISKILFHFSEILLKESDKQALNSISHQGFDKYITLQKQLDKKLAIAGVKMQEIGKSGLQIINESDLEQHDFYSSMLPKHFTALATNWKKAKFFDLSTLHQKLEDGIFYKKSTKDEVIAKIESVLPQLLDLYAQSEELYSSATLFQLFRESLIPMSVLSYIHSALEQIKQANNVHLISDFNELIFNKIQNEPTPFIYERLGEKFQHYFVDEMQDTSILQWKNLAKLIENALSEEGGSLLLVGDAKQAIYRWRGGESEQFIDLANPVIKGPFQAEKRVEHLATNYRSFSEIINFNNSFFQHISSLLQNEIYAKLYKDENQQKTNSKIGGYVQIDFINSKEAKKNEDPDLDVLYPKKVLETIQNLDPSFDLKDVCVLVRKKSQGVAIANYLNEKGIAIISSESLLLASNSKVDFLINLMRIIWKPKDAISRFNVLDFLYKQAQVSADKHEFLSELIHLDENNFFKALAAYDYVFDKHIFIQKSLYDSIEYSIRAFKLTEKSDAYLQFFLDAILDFQLKQGSDLAQFLTYWEQQKEGLSISMPEGKNAVQIMTIHKAKGLQFPVVIFPYDMQINYQIQPNIWYPIAEPEKSQGFKKMLIPYRKSLEYTNDTGAQLYQERQEVLELDSYNLLYVTLTRAIEQLYIITEHKITTKGAENTHFFSGLFINYLKATDTWNQELLAYSFGSKDRIIIEKEIKKSAIKSVFSYEFISTDIAQHQVNFYASSSLLWDTEQGEAIAYGNLLHDILSHIFTADDIEQTLQRYLSQGIINKVDSSALQNKIEKIIEHPNLKIYYQHNLTVYNEREIVNTQGVSIIPDRVVILPNKKAVVIDYKTGMQENIHKTQVENYARYLSEMGYEVASKLLVYIGDVVEVVSV